VFYTGSSEGMRLTSTGLGIGTSSPASKLHIDGNFIRIEQSGANTAYFGNAGDLITGAPAGAAIRFNNTALRIAYSSTQIAMFDSSGNLGIGTTSPANKLHVATGMVRVDSGYGIEFGGTTNFIIGNSPANTIRLYTNNAEAARIDSSGNLLVGTTSEPNGSNSGVKLVNPDTAPSRFATTTTATKDHIYFMNPNNVVGSIATSASVTLFNTTSDQRLKENIKDADEASNVIDAIQVRKYDWKSGGSHQRYGFIAQELLTVAPEAVSQPENPEQMMAVDYSKLVPMLVKEIQSLRKRLADAGI
jgi:hypothetical protein